jgi:hypothetical protein
MHLKFLIVTRYDSRKHTTTHQTNGDKECHDRVKLYLESEAVIKPIKIEEQQIPNKKE